MNHQEVHHDANISKNPKEIPKEKINTEVEQSKQEIPKEKINTKEKENINKKPTETKNENQEIPSEKKNIPTDTTQNPKQQKQNKKNTNNPPNTSTNLNSEQISPAPNSLKHEIHPVPKIETKPDSVSNQVEAILSENSIDDIPLVIALQNAKPEALMSSKPKEHKEPKEPKKKNKIKNKIKHQKITSWFDQLNITHLLFLVPILLGIFIIWMIYLNSESQTSTDFQIQD